MGPASGDLPRAPGGGEGPLDFSDRIRRSWWPSGAGARRPSRRRSRLVPDDLPIPGGDVPPRPPSAAEPVIILGALALVIAGIVAWAVLPARRPARQVGAVAFDRPLERAS